MPQIKPGDSNLFPALIAGFCLIFVGRAAAQTFAPLYSFTAQVSDTNGDGAFPRAGLIVSGGTLYGTASQGGTADNGTIFMLSTNGTGFTTIASFPALVSEKNSDGANPYAGLILLGNALYGTVILGGNGGGGPGSGGNGTVFKVNIDKSGFAALYNFTGNYFGDGDGTSPSAGLVLSGSTLYGTTAGGGSSGYGTVFKVDTNNGSGFATLYSFTNGNDGNSPGATLIVSGNTLYGTVPNGGTSGGGTVFAVSTNGMGFTNVYGFTGGTDGGSPGALLVLSGNTLYGTTAGGGNSGTGTVFAVNTDGSGFTNLHNFTALSGNRTNSDGSSPGPGLILSGNTLFGTTPSGGSSGRGTVFAVNTNGTGFTNLYNFALGGGGNTPAGLVLSGNTLYGTTFSGGTNNTGAVFSISLPGPPQLAINLSGTNAILTWTNTALGFTLQSTTDLLTAAWRAVSPGPVVINGQNTVTNPIAGTQQFYELSQ